MMRSETHAAHRSPAVLPCMLRTCAVHTLLVTVDGIGRFDTGTEMTDSTAALPLDAASAERQRSVKRRVRGSSLLLGGRFVAKGMNFAIQILIVRYLSQSDYGALAYALSIVAVGEALAKFGMQQAVTRYLPIYQVQERYDALFGTLFMAAGVVLSLGLVIALLPYAILGFLGRPLIGDARAWSLLMVLIFLVPVQVFDQLLTSVFAVFSSPRLIFLRKHVLGRD